MKTINKTFWPVVCACASLSLFAQQPEQSPPATSGQSPEAAPAAPTAVSAPSGEGEANIRLNFRGAPLDMVLNHLSEAAGFIIILEADVKGTVDVWSGQPLNKEEAVDVLDTVLRQNGYAAIRNGRTLTIVNQNDAKTRSIPVQSGRDPEVIPRTDEMVTQVIPIRYARAEQMVANLQGLLPTYATLTSNESGNALVLTSTKANVKRMVEIVQALDTSISSISSVRVFPLNHGDATQVAQAIERLFENSGSQGRGNERRNPFQFGRGRGGDDDNRGGGTGSSEALAAASRVVAVADERTNSLVVGAPEEYMPVIEDLVRQIDVSVTDITEVRVFSLQHADPMELAQIFAEMFPDTTNQQDQGRGGFRFGRDRGRGGNQEQGSDRMKKQGKVTAVADPRTSSLIVSAAAELMPQIEEMVSQLDTPSGKRQRVFVYSLENADVVEVEQILRGMFERTTTMGNRTGQNQNSALGARSQNNSQTGAGTGIGGGGFGGGGGLGGARTGNAFQ